MIWANILVFLVSTVKFLFAAAAGKTAGNDFFTTFFLAIGIIILDNFIFRDRSSILLVHLIAGEIQLRLHLYFRQALLF